jgi:hypothetical protein
LDVLVCSFGVGSTGLTLTKSCRIILLDRPWTPGDAKQAEDRVRRIGQHASEVQSFWIAGFSFDDSLDKLLQKKDRNTLRVIEVQDGEAALRGGRVTSSWFSGTTSSERRREGSGSLSSKTQQHDLRDYFRSCEEGRGSGEIVSAPDTQSLRPWWECSSSEGEGAEPEEAGRGKENHEPEPQLSVMRAVLREILL